MKKALLFFSLVFLSSYFIIWKWYGLNNNFSESKKFHYRFELKNQETSHQEGLYFSLKGKLSITYLKEGQGLLLEFDQVRGLYGTDEADNKFKSFLSQQMKRPILFKKSKGGFSELLYPGQGEDTKLASKLFKQIVYYLTIPFPGNKKEELPHLGPYGKSYLTYKRGKDHLSFNIQKRLPFNGHEISNGTFKSLFTPGGYVKKLTGIDEDFKGQGNRVLTKSKMELSFELLSISQNHQVNLQKIIQNSITTDK